MYPQYQRVANTTGGTTYIAPSAPSTTISHFTVNASSLPGIQNGSWYPGISEVTDLHMGIALSALIFYGIIMLTALFFFIVWNRCRIFKNGWWINVITVCFCRLASSAFTIHETLNAKDDKLYQRQMYGTALGNDILCLVAFYMLHLSFVNRLCYVVKKKSLVNVCFWLMISHLFAEPFLIIATGSTLKGRQPIHKIQEGASEQLKQQIGKELLLVGLVIGLYCFVIQSAFAIVAIKKARGSSGRMRLFEIGLLLMIPLIVTRVVSVVFMFWAPVWINGGGIDYAEHNVHNANGKVIYYRLYIEIIPEILTMLLALTLIYLAPHCVQEESRLRDVESVACPEVECLSRPGAPGMAFTPLKLNSTNILMQWYNSHLSDPFPTDEEKLDLVVRTGFTMDMINNWFKDTRECTRIQNTEDNETVESEAPLINSTDGVHDTSETRALLFRTMMVPPPLMLGPRPNTRIMTPPSGPVSLRMPIPGSEPEMRSTASHPDISMRTMNWALRSMRNPNAILLAEKSMEIVRHASSNTQIKNQEKLHQEGTWMQPRALSRRSPNRARQTPRTTSQHSMHSRSIQKKYVSSRIVDEDWEINLPRRRSSLTMARIQELTHTSSSEEAAQLD